ncbi:protein kinase [Colletotrichum truncatum]|uniref:Protein kinase n=1 Tax=Colletotrichum truncatum TaxID=5467 RepID=A0ACC3YTG6_COLTU|nr:protein kinase [Colletotrichum truncatum]KAF6798429.1 protein kinase [Colletotrichum truncatum]
MSHRPLDILKREQRAADRSPHLRTRRNGPMTDTIDGLDTVGGIYHHGGPYDATLASRNRNKMYAPVEAVKESNMEALKATPREYIQDSLDKHVPLQGTGTIPAGGSDMRGNIMDYKEGADLMREPDAKGGAYKRWDGIPYHPDDLKGKGEPSYTYEKDLKEKKRMRKASLGNSPAEFEMRSGLNGRPHKEVGAVVRQRSFSNAADGRPGPLEVPAGQSHSADIHRHNSTGKRLSEGLKRRFGSLRRKNQAAA